MRPSNIVLVLIALMVSGSGWTQEADATNAMAEQWQAEQVERDVRQERLDELMAAMAEEMQTIRSTSNRKERQALMATHRETMREAMQLMQGMGGMHMRAIMAEHVGPGAEPATDANRPRHQHRRITATRPRDQMTDAERLADLETRLDMMQVMMESMMDEYVRQ